jgi:uncharacterized membrane protein (UPF0182 family)
LVRKNWQIVIPLLLLLLLSFSNAIVTFWADWLWFEETGYAVLFTRSVFAEIWLTLVFGAVFFVEVAEMPAARSLAHRIPITARAVRNFSARRIEIWLR